MQLFTIVGFIIPAIFDLIFTLLGQPASYWSHYASVQEGSPGGYALLSVHPLAFILVFLAYLAGAAFILRRWKNVTTLIFGIALFTGHAWGSSSWIPILLQSSNWYVFIVYFIFISIPLGVAFNREIHYVRHTDNHS